MKITKALQAISEVYGLQIALFTIFTIFLIALVLTDQITPEAAIAAVVVRVLASSTLWKQSG